MYNCPLSYSARNILDVSSYPISNKVAFNHSSVLSSDSSVFDKIKILFKENYGREVYFVKDSNITNDINVYLLRSDK